MESLRRLTLACALTVIACTPKPDPTVNTPLPIAATGDPEALETHIDRLDDRNTRRDAFAQLERIVRELERDPKDPRRAAFVEVVLPAFVDVYATGEFANYRDAILAMTLRMAQPEALTIWAH